MPSCDCPSWQLEQVPEASEWLNLLLETFQLEVKWQLPQLLVVFKWEAPFPVAFDPLWHEEHVPVTAV